MSSPASLDSSAALRALIRAKRTHGENAVALVLARLGSRAAASEKLAGARDEVSRIALTRYLELMPDDTDVRRTLSQLDGAAPSTSGGKRTTRRWLPWFLLGASGVAAAGAIHFNSAPRPLPDPVAPRSQIVAVVEVPPPAKSADAIVIRAVGDVVLGSDYPRIRLPGKEDQARMVALRQEFKDADIVVGNLEGVLSDRGKARKDVSKKGMFTFRMPKGYAPMLREIGFDVMSLANNHSMDFGTDGLESTVRALKEAGIQPVGIPGAETAVVKVRDTSVAFLNYSYLSTFAHLDDGQRVSADIGRARKSADLVIVTVHGGKEGLSAIGAPRGDEYFMDEHRGDIAKFSRLAIDAGACAVFGHGPHVVRPFEVYKGRPIFFSLGNFVGYRSLSTKGRLANSIIAEVRLSPGGELLGAGVVPLKLDRTGIPRADYSAASLDSLDLLLDERLEKRPVLALDLRPLVSWSELESGR